MPRFAPVLAVFALALAGCMSGSTDTASYVGARLPDASLAIVAERDATAGLQSISKGGVEVWRRKANFSEQSVTGGVTKERVKLEPGRYTIVSLLWCSSAYAYEISGHKSSHSLAIRHTEDADLAAGHSYEVRGENTGYLCNEGPKLWIEDLTAGGALKTVSSNEQLFPR